MNTVDTFLGSAGMLPPLLPPRTPWHQDRLFSTTTICFQDFSRKPAQEHESDRFPWLGYPAVCNYKTVGMCLFLCRALEHPLALCGRTRLRGGCGRCPPPAGCSAFWVVTEGLGADGPTKTAKPLLSLFWKGNTLRFWGRLLKFKASSCLLSIIC